MHAPKTPSDRLARCVRRRGLAPLELVLSLPLMMFVMALMMNFGAAASWKVRAAVAARHAMWRSRAMWNGSQDPNPPNWPPPATMGAGPTNPLQTISVQWDRPEINQPFARGPIITVPNAAQDEERPYIQVRDARLYDMPNNISQGYSHITRQYPLLPSLSPYSYDVKHPLVDSRWQFQTMGYADNLSRRAKGWYNLEMAPEWAEQAARSQAADMALQSNPNQQKLIPLDRDDEFMKYTGSSPDFYPKVGGCGLSRTEVDQTQITNVGGLLDRIRGRKQPHIQSVPETMARAFIKMYESEIKRIQHGGEPQGASVGDLETKIQQLQKFLQRL